MLPEERRIVDDVLAVGRDAMAVLDTDSGSSSRVGLYGHAQRRSRTHVVGVVGFLLGVPRRPLGVPRRLLGAPGFLLGVPGFLLGMKGLVHGVGGYFRGVAGLVLGVASALLVLPDFLSDFLRLWC